MTATGALLESAEPPSESNDETLDRLAALPPLEYEQVREQEAKRLKVRVSILDREVEGRREPPGEESGDIVEDDEPWLEAVDGNKLLQEIRAILVRYVILPEGAATALALWILFTYCLDAFRICPLVLVTSPIKRCGKSTLLGVMAPLIKRGIPASNISTPAIYRTIDKHHPSIVLDEGDTFLSENEESRGIINSRHTRDNAFVVRCVGDDHEPKKFSTWGAKIIGMIKKPNGTIIDRSIVIEMRRRLPGEQVEKLPLNYRDLCPDIRRRCQRWADDNLEALRVASPQLPASSNDRAVDNWTPLFAIAETVGGNWPEDAKVAFQALTIEDDEDAIGPMLLEDIQLIFQEQRTGRLHSTDLVEHLTKLEERPWNEWRRGKPLTANSLSHLPKPFQIRSKQVRAGASSKNRNGYELADFQDAFDRYLAPSSSPEPLKTTISNSTTLHPNNGAGCGQIQSSTEGNGVEFQNSTEGTA